MDQQELANAAQPQRCIRSINSRRLECSGFCIMKSHVVEELHNLLSQFRAYIVEVANANNDSPHYYFLSLLAYVVFRCTTSVSQL